MQKEISEILPVFGVEHDSILSKQGDVTIAYEVQLPEIFTLSVYGRRGIGKTFLIRNHYLNCIATKSNRLLRDKVLVLLNDLVTKA